MFQYHCLNPIASVGLDGFGDNYRQTDDFKEADAVLVRSAKMLDMELPGKLLAVGRAGAGVNNIPLDRCADQGIVVFNTPGANSNGVKELVLAGMLLASRDIVGGIEWVNSQKDNPDVGKLAEKQKKQFAGSEISGKKLGIIGLGAIGQKNRVLTAIRMEPRGEFYSKWKAIEAMEAGEVVIMSAGTGSPYFTTDTGSSLRGIEIEADVMLKGTRVDGVYTADPEKDPAATKYHDITYSDVIAKGLKVMDITATAMCMQNDLPIYVFNMDVLGNLKKVIDGEDIGTLVHN